MRECNLRGAWSVAAFSAALLSAATAAEAFQRNISFCNRTERDVHVALGYDRAGTSETTSEGWFKVRGCTCRSLVSADLRATEIFFLVTRSGVDNLLRDARGPLCANPRNGFTYVSENASQAACNRAGGQWVGFKWFDTANRTNYSLNFRAAGQCNRMGD